MQANLRTPFTNNLGLLSELKNNSCNLLLCCVNIMKSSSRPEPMSRERSRRLGISLNNKLIPQRLQASNKNKRVSFKSLQNSPKNSASKPGVNSRSMSQRSGLNSRSMTQKNRGINPIIKDELKFNFTDPLKINTNLVKIKDDLLSDYINYLVELKNISEKNRSIFTSKPKISDIIDKKLRQLQKIKGGDLQRENS